MQINTAKPLCHRWLQLTHDDLLALRAAMSKMQLFQLAIITPFNLNMSCSEVKKQYILFSSK